MTKNYIVGKNEGFNVNLGFWILKDVLMFKNEYTNVGLHNCKSQDSGRRIIDNKLVIGPDGRAIA